MKYGNNFYSQGCFKYFNIKHKIFELEFRAVIRVHLSSGR